MNRQLPCATYRLQFNAHFTLADALGIVDYLSLLGITHVYASPLMAARPGSLHGYDVIDPERLNPELGTEEDFVRFADRLRERKMGLLIDVVPNHMCTEDPGNRWWMDVLENGPSSPYAHFFDIDWHPPKIDLLNKVLLPILGDQYGTVLENQGIQVVLEEGAFAARVNHMKLPLAPGTWDLVLDPAIGLLKSQTGDLDPDVQELESIRTALGHLPGRTETDPQKMREIQREQGIIKKRLRTLLGASDRARRAVECSLQGLNGVPGVERSFDRLELLLQAQVYRLCFWRVAADEVNYRRFFDVSSLAALRVEEPDVFQAVHQWVLEHLKQGRVTGLRIDHVDGLYDPEAYLRRLDSIAPGSADVAFDRRSEVAGRAYTVVEKILSRQEHMSDEWMAHGTTGYDYLNLLNGLFVDASNRTALLDVYGRFTGHTPTPHHQVASCKRLIMHVSMASELYMLASKLDRISEQHRSSRDFTLESLRFGLREVVARFPAYRTYIRAGSDAVGPEDRKRVEQAVYEAIQHNRSTSVSLFQFIRQIWLLEHPPGISEVHKEERRNFVMRLQQFTGPVMAKALEDTYFYREFPLSSLNEVGGDPNAFGTAIDLFHRKNEERLKHWPHSLLATSTHDTKRSEDVRARINVLSENPTSFYRTLLKWQKVNRDKKKTVEGVEVPDPNEEYLLYQTLLGAWPMGPLTPESRVRFSRRIEDYMGKALREAKVHSSWIHPNEPYEAAVRHFIQSVLDPSEDNPFLLSFLEFHRPIREAGMMNSLSQTLLKIASPGIPDFFQGAEGWDLRLVDPDNRQPVDFPLRRELLASIEELEGEGETGPVDSLIQSPEDGRIKVHVIRRALGFRSRHPELFARGAYTALDVVGEWKDNVCAFARTAEGEAAVVISGRFFLQLKDAAWPFGGSRWWGKTAVAVPRGWSGGFRDLLTGTTEIIEHQGGLPVLPLGRLFGRWPLAFLEPIRPA
jgi:(1->4)-alpha-D-glucan 1-alpha-D-glucosylmutase